MDFASSTHARSWLFTNETLTACREQSVQAADIEERGKPRPRNLASGYHHALSNAPCVQPLTPPPPSDISPIDQETLIRFHSHQIQTLVGPTAIVCALRNSEKALSTAIMVFRRFYLSNSVVDFNPRQIAAGAAFLASKLEEERIEIGLLSHATAVVQLKVQNAPLCWSELCTVSVHEIEQAERDLMAGLNYQFHCHHPTATIDFLSSDIAAFQQEAHEFVQDGREPLESMDVDDATITTGSDKKASIRDRADDLWERAAEVALRATIFSDVCFLYSPSAIAFAMLAVVMDSVDENDYIGDDMLDYIVSRFPLKSEEDIVQFTNEISAIVRQLVHNPWMDLRPKSARASFIVSTRADELRRVLLDVSSLRQQRRRAAAMKSSPNNKNKRVCYEQAFTPPRGRRFYHKMAKITPPGHY